MNEGLLWYDNDPDRLLVEKIERAVARFQVRLRAKPTVCYLSEAEYDAKIAEVNGVWLKPSSQVRPHYLWIGIEGDSQAADS